MLVVVFPLWFFFFNDTATTEIYTLSLHDALPIWPPTPPVPRSRDSPAPPLGPFPGSSAQDQPQTPASETSVPPALRSSHSSAAGWPAESPPPCPRPPRRAGPAAPSCCLPSASLSVLPRPGPRDRDPGSPASNKGSKSSRRASPPPVAPRSRCAASKSCPARPCSDPPPQPSACCLERPPACVRSSPERCFACPDLQSLPERRHPSAPPCPPCFPEPQRPRSHSRTAWRR